MKRSISVLCLACLLCFWIIADAKTTVVMVGQPTSGGASPVLKDNPDSSGTGYVGFGRYASALYASESWVAQYSYTMTSVVVRLATALGDVSSKTYTVEIRLHDGTNPNNSVIGSGTLTGVTTANDYEATLAVPIEITATTRYCAVAYPQGGADGNNYAYIYYNTSGTESVEVDSDGQDAWTDTDATATARIKTYGY